MPELLNLGAARALVVQHAWTLPFEQVPLAEALGRTLAEDHVAPIDLPPFANSAMDGFAVRSEDVAAADQSPVHLRIAGESRAGGPFEGTLAPGEAVAVSTGAMLPDGADAVVRIEEIERPGEAEISVAGSLKPGHDVRPAGDDVRAGERVIVGGVRIAAGEIAMLASTGAASVACVRRPRVSVAGTGDELVSPGEPLATGKIYDSNSSMIAALVRGSGAELAGVTTAVRDDDASTAAAVATALAAADVTIICGGVSVGEHDHVKPSLRAAGVREIFWHAAMRPGHPIWFGALGEPGDGGKLVFGLPGNPVAAFTTFHMFALPALRVLSGLPPWPRVVTARLAAAQRKRAGFAQVLRCRLSGDGDGGWIASLTSGNQGSHAVSSIVGVDGLAILPAELADPPAGSEVVVELLAGFVTGPGA